MSSLWPLTVAVVTVLTLALSPPAVGKPVSHVVENLNHALLGVMKEADQLGFSGRYQRLAPVMTASYDFPFVSRIVVGRYWKQFSQEQKSKFVETFTNLSIATYAGRFDGYSGERFEVVSTEELRHGRQMVKSTLIKPDGEVVHLDYILHQNENRWRIINVIANGVSDLSLKRADYSSFLKTKGFDDLLRALNDKILQYSQ
ncbi:MAG: HpnM family protein [Deltaproteobacteria bacterium]|nr:MAG: HpnM family protein [Deltaproteobacteria bacterium]